MVIAASIIKKPRAIRKCYECGKIIQGPTLRIFGAAFYGDSPYAVYMHPECNIFRHEMVTDAIATLSVGQGG